MRYSQLFLPTLKETPGKAEVISHKLLLRGGFIRKLTSGIYSYLPLGLIVIRKIEQIVREEMNQAGAQELLMPMVQPADLWIKSERWDKYGQELLRFTDRHGRQSCLGPTHEEVITDLVGKNIHSYKELPLNLYQIQSKFRDEIRPRFGLMRGREFMMKDGYSFDATEQEATETYRKMYDAYHRIFSRCGLEFRAVTADTGAIGGSFSHEFMVLADTGEDTIVICSQCDYAANMEKAGYMTPKGVPATTVLLPLQKIETYGKRKVSAVTEFLNIPPDKLLKTMVYLVDKKPVAVLLRGDHEVQPVKLINFLKATEVEMADEKQIFDTTGVASGYLGPIGLKIPMVADQEITRMVNFTIGGNEKNYHFINANLKRDFNVLQIADLRMVTAEDHCPECGGALTLTKGIEIGHIFKLGVNYSKQLNAFFLDNEGISRPFIMGCYGIGISRIVAAAIEQNHDQDGMIFPLPIAPAQVIILNLAIKDEEISQAATNLYETLLMKNIETLLDDRDERAGVKFKDADLIGIPYRITVGRNFSREGMIEIKSRATGEVITLPHNEIVTKLVEIMKH